MNREESWELLCEWTRASTSNHDKRALTFRARIDSDGEPDISVDL
jgi:hypothetical protein